MTPWKTLFATIILLSFAASSQAQTQLYGTVPAQGQAVTTGNGIEYHGGPVMLGPHNVYIVWYGNWAGNSAVSILPDFVASLDGSPYFNTNVTYGDSRGNIANTVTLSRQFFDNYSQGTVLNDQSLINVIFNALNTGTFPIDTNGVYFVLTSPDVAEVEPGLQFCTQICGYHSRASIFANDIKYAFVGNPDRCLANNNSCFEFFPSPNNNSAADAMASIMAHELNETVTDPDLNAWFHINLSGENGDLCHPSIVGYQNTFLLGNGAVANIILGANAYLIQSNFVNASGTQGGCQMSFQQNSDFSLSATPSSATVAQGGPSVTYQVSINRTGSFTGAVNFFASNPPNSTLSGITASFSPAPTNGNSTTMTVTASSNATPGTFRLIINGTSGSLVRTTTVGLTITGNFSLSTFPINQVLVPGTSNTVDVFINRTGGFSSPVSFSASGLPTGVTASFSPNNTSGGASTLTLTAASTVTLGTVPVTITGTSGNITHTAAFNLTTSLTPAWWEAVHQILTH